MRAIFLNSERTITVWAGQVRCMIIVELMSRSDCSLPLQHWLLNIKSWVLYWCFRSFSASDVVSFDGGSSGLLYWLTSGLKRTSRDVVTLKFKALRNSGTLLQAEGQEGLSLSLELERGKLLLLLRQGKHTDLLTDIKNIYMR